MSSDLVQRALKRHAYLWSIHREVVSSSPIETHPLAFLVRTRTEADATSIVTTLSSAHAHIVTVERTWWRLGRRWKIVAKTDPMPFSEENIEAWVRSTASLVAQFDGLLVHYHPFEPLAAPAA